MLTLARLERYSKTFYTGKLRPEVQLRTLLYTIFDGKGSPRGGGVLPYKRLMGMCSWMGSHFHDWIDYNGVVFSIELLEWGRTFSDFCGKTVIHSYG